MPTEKKVSRPWYLAATHFLTSGFAIPFVISLVWGFLSAALLPEGGMTAIVLGIIVSAIAVWLGVLYSANYIRKKYELPDPSKIVRLSTIYMAVSYLLYDAFIFAGAFVALSTESEATGGVSIAIVLGVLQTIVNVSIFYLVSRSKFVRS